MSKVGGIPWIEVHSGANGVSVISPFGHSDNLRADGSTLTASFTQPFATRIQRLSLQQDGRLRVDTHTRFTEVGVGDPDITADGSGRQDYDLAQYFVRERSGESTPSDQQANSGGQISTSGAEPTREQMIECINFYVGDLDKAKSKGVSVWEGLDYSAQFNAFQAIALAHDQNQQLLPNYYKAARQKYREIMTRAGLKFDPR